MPPAADGAGPAGQAGFLRINLQAACHEPALFALTPSTPSRTDLTVDLNIVQARAELHRALDFGNLADRAAWAERWGEAALEAAEEGMGARDLLEDGPDLPDVSWEEPDVTDLREALNDARRAVQRAIDDPAANLAHELAEAREALNDASKELDRL